MDLVEYMPMFLAESRAHLQELNLAVLRLAESPDDSATVDEIFRIAHSLKGTSATMGFAQIAALTHAMEDVFELLRQRTDGLERDAVDTLLECLDALAAAADAIEVDGEERLDPARLIERLGGLARTRSPEQELAQAGGVDLPQVAAPDPTGPPVIHLVAVLGAEALMPAVRAYMIFAALEDHGEIVGSIPARDGVEQFDGKRIEVWLESGHEPAAIAAAARTVSDVEEVTATIVEPQLAAATAAEPVRTGSTVAPSSIAPILEPDPPCAAPPGAGAETVRVDASRLDQLMRHIGEVVIHRTAIEAIAGGLRVPELTAAVQELTRSSQALQAMLMQVRVQLVRNALDHGLEPAAERLAAGKPPTGTLEISARQAGGSVVISVRDDGHGIDPALVARKAVERGLITAHDVEVILDSSTGLGSCAQIRLPPTLAIVSVILIEACGEPFAVPLDRVARTLRLDEHPVRTVCGRRMLLLRDGVIPLLDAGVALAGGDPAEHEFALIVDTGDRRLALSVGALIGQRELVARALPAVVRDGQAVFGGAVLPDGRIALIVDCDVLASRAGEPIQHPAHGVREPVQLDRTGRSARDVTPCPLTE